MKNKKEPKDLNWIIETLESKMNYMENEQIQPQHHLDQQKESQLENTEIITRVIKDAHGNLFSLDGLASSTANKYKEFHYYKDKESGDIECFEVASNKVISRVILGNNEDEYGSFQIFKLEEKIPLKYIDTSYRKRLTPLETKKQIDAYISRIKELVNYEDLQEASKRTYHNMNFSIL